MSQIIKCGAQLSAFSRIVQVERMHLPDLTMWFKSEGNGTLLTMRMTLPDAKTRATMLATGMERGMEASFVRFETHIAREWQRVLEKGDRG